MSVCDEGVLKSSADVSSALNATFTLLVMVMEMPFEEDGRTGRSACGADDQAQDGAKVPDLWVTGLRDAVGLHALDPRGRPGQVAYKAELRVLVDPLPDRVGARQGQVGIQRLLRDLQVRARHQDDQVELVDVLAALAGQDARERRRGRLNEQRRIVRVRFRCGHVDRKVIDRGQDAIERRAELGEACHQATIGRWNGASRARTSGSWRLIRIAPKSPNPATPCGDSLRLKIATARRTAACSTSGGIDAQPNLAVTCSAGRGEVR